MNEVIFIRFIPKYSDCAEDVGIAINREVAERYVRDLTIQYPDCYIYGSFLYEEFDLIKD